MSTVDTKRGHNFDDDCVCTDCGFDGAEWSHWKNYTYEGKASPNAKKPFCTHVGRAKDVYPPIQQDLDDDNDYIDETGCGHCHGDGLDPMNDYLTPCPSCHSHSTP